ncbi:hypothetical protein HYW17_04815 [Candidatus Uhrbacteria bacterium]|nr:hypothetical protein [Candidatus Uhrbacteria bacterium]
MGARILIIATTIFTWLLWGFVLIRFEPSAGAPWSLILFYGTLTLALFGTFLNIGMAWNTRNLGRLPLGGETGIIIRHAVLLTLFILVILNLAAIRLLRVWSVIPLALLVILIEFFLDSLIRRGAR